MKKDFKNHIYSFSQLSSFETCPYGFFLNKIEKVDQVSNIFAEQGSLIHDLIDKWAKREILKKDLAIEYDERYEKEVVTRAPATLGERYEKKTREQGRKYFEDFNSFTDYGIISTEEKFETKIGKKNRRFTGVVDMICINKKTGELIILDHKSKSKTEFNKHKSEMYKQLYIYSKFIHDTWGRYPDRLGFNLFKENGFIETIKFDKNEYKEVLKWAEKTISEIEETCKNDNWKKNPEYFFCANLCSVRNACKNKEKEEKANGENEG